MAQKLKVAPIEQDITAMSQETGTAVFSYNDIHNAKVDNELHYDYKKVIDGVSAAQKISSTEAEKKLLDCGVLRPLPNGEYMVDVGYTTRAGGARNKNGIAFFTFSDEDIHNQYHEMAHSYQRRGNLFDDDKLDKMYSVSEKGLLPNENRVEKLADRDTYKAYLKETHAEIFAQTALMLRTNNAISFAKQAVYAQSFGENRNATGLLAGILDERLAHKAKLYACKPVMYAAIKEVAAIRKSGNRADYFNQDGTLNAEKVSNLCEKIVLNNAYSPRTYKAFLDNNFNDSHTAEEKNWQKGSLLSVAKALPANAVMAVYNGTKNVKNIINKIKHNSLRRKEAALLKHMVKHRKTSDNPQIQATNDYAYIQAKMLLVGASSKYKDADDAIIEMVTDMHKNEISAKDLQQMSAAIKATGSYNVFSEINAIIKQNKDNPYFNKIMDNPANLANTFRGQAKSGQDREKGEFLHNLRMGRNLHLNKTEGLTARARSASPQQLNLTQRMPRNEEKSM